MGSLSAQVKIQPCCWFMKSLFVCFTFVAARDWPKWPSATGCCPRHTDKIPTARCQTGGRSIEGRESGHYYTSWVQRLPRKTTSGWNQVRGFRPLIGLQGQYTKEWQDYRDNGIAQWLKRFTQDRKVLGSGPSHVEPPLWDWAPHISSSSYRSNKPPA